ncbi:hypothetical protein SERLA73DRAFT_25601, partial [Serpula lacrymans var. lacrymans S7.3]
YQTTVDDLECLIVMRLFELSKILMPGTDKTILCIFIYLPSHISKGLQRRSEAICDAINCYNVQADLLNPPRPKISWKDIANFTFLGEFNLLRDARTDICMQDWTKPANRAACVKYFKLCRAREEIVRLNVEMCCLQTAIYNEENKVTQVIQELNLSNPMLGGELKQQWLWHSAVNQV